MEQKGRKIPNKEASLVILTYKGRILLILRDNNPEVVSPNHWAVPGGVKEINETFEQTALREIKEELNIDLKNLKFLVELKYLDRFKKLYFSTLSEAQVKEIILYEGQKFDFFTPEEASHLLLARSTKLFFDSYLHLIKSVL